MRAFAARLDAVYEQCAGGEPIHVPEAPAKLARANELSLAAPATPD